MAGQNPGLDGGGAVLGADIGAFHADRAVLLHAQEPAAAAVLTMGKIAVKDRLQGVQIVLSRLVQNLGLRQFGQFVAKLGLFFGQFAPHALEPRHVSGDGGAGGL